MAISNFIPQLWSATLLETLKKSLVYGGPAVCNRDYEGEIQAQGNTVNITSIVDPTISSYSKDTDITVQTLTDAQRQLVITEQKYFGFEVDDIDYRQSVSGGALMNEAADRSGFLLGDTADSFIAGVLNASATGLGSVQVSETTTNNTDVYNKLLVPLRTALTKQNVPSAGRFAVLTPDLMGQLLLDGRFIKFDEAGAEMALFNGVVGRAAGFTIYESNNAPAVSGSAGSVTDAVTVSGSATVTSASKAFTQREVGAVITGTGIPSGTTILSVALGADRNPNGTITLSKVATASGTVTATVAAPASTGTLVLPGQVVVAGSNMGATYAEQISKIEAFRPEKRFADALKGLHVYGAKVVRPEALIAADVFINA